MGLQTIGMMNISGKQPKAAATWLIGLNKNITCERLRRVMIARRVHRYHM